MKVGLFEADDLAKKKISFKSVSKSMLRKENSIKQLSLDKISIWLRLD